MWDSGGWQWSDQHRADYSNDLDDPRTLQAVTRRNEPGQGERRRPSNWIPTNEAEVCTYLADWLAIKARWSLSMDQSEAGRIRNLLDDRCPDQTVTQWPQAPPWTPTSTTTSTTLVGTAVAPTTLPAIPLLVDSPCDPSYPDECIPPSPPDLDCGQIPFRDFRVLPPDPHRFDGNHDGVGCEEPGRFATPGG